MNEGVDVRAIHQAALDAIAARQAGDFAAYAAALRRLYQLGATGDRVATWTEIQQIASQADTAILGAGAFGSVRNLAIILAIGVGLYLAWPLMRRRV